MNYQERQPLDHIFSQVVHFLFFRFAHIQPSPLIDYKQKIIHHNSSNICMYALYIDTVVVLLRNSNWLNSCVFEKGLGPIDQQRGCVSRGDGGVALVAMM